MATYNKRGYKAPKPEQEKEDNEFDQYTNIDSSNSKTAEVFDSLDQGANRMESWVVRNQKVIFGLVGAVAIATLGYVGYDKFIVEPKNDDAANEMFQAQSYYNNALMNTTAKDSLFNLALNGGEGKLGFLGIIENYGGTQSSDLAHYYAGTAYLHMNKYEEAIKHLEKFKSNDIVMASQALGAIGDAFSELKQYDQALEYYKQAASKHQNDFTTPRFLNKAGLVALELGKKEEALKNFNEIKNNYQGSVEYRGVDALIGLAQ
ncbi:tetratricopeptide repeat protein [Myroides marinus]|uniref:tetratricopeptide repeat protein n=1 Tax=Myroides marinus TaxID=703342 RepID=UPI002575F915|nr:tetratricopeptide repeat protein [Myroides marinus]MDM1347691.1 tetratricopeptide repeat protein [Myroides marinus]MDM1351364.1 tetratricopeptide repeat protein [Myroides marinus]MDM1354741.1 tetratricopeptide repeat protein [Myroides marinus]MDM1358571.1 tetratricopeptide repeat protein [Myroides marinus]MDM1365710.1 tetratricopeptide repeat protein [Myroides marinus]